MSAAVQMKRNSGPTRPAATETPQARREREERLSATLLRLGKLNQEALERINELQRQTNAPFAKAASRLGLITKEDVATALGVQNGFLREGEGEGRLPSSIVVVRHPGSKEAEQFRAIRTGLLTSPDSEKFKLFAIASMRSSREADHVANNLAASLAQIGRRVLIVDADFRATRLAVGFSVSRDPGMKETLAGACDIRNAIRPTVIANLSVLTSGAVASNGYDLLAADTLRLTFEYLRCAFDNVIVMTSPYGTVADAQFVWAATRNVYAVVRRHDDRGAELAALHKAVRKAGAETIGAVLA